MVILGVQVAETSGVRSSASQRNSRMGVEPGTPREGPSGDRKL